MTPAAYAREKTFVQLDDEGDRNSTSLFLSLTRLRDFRVKKGVEELALQVEDWNRGRLHPQ